MLRYVTVEKCKRRRVNDTSDSKVVNKTNDTVSLPDDKCSSCTKSKTVRPRETGSDRFPSIPGKTKSKTDRKPTRATGAESSASSDKAREKRVMLVKHSR